MSLRARIMLLVLLATLLPTVVVGLYEIGHRASQIDEAKHSLSSLAKYAADNLKDKVDGTVQLLHGLSRAPDLITSDRAVCSEFLAQVLARYPQYTGLLTIAPDGNLFCDSLRTGRELNLSSREYFKQAQATREPAFDVVIGGLTGIAVLQVAYPAVDAQGTLKFVVLASLNLDQFARDVAAASSYEDTRVVIWNRNGKLMTRQPAAAGASLAGKDFSESELFRFAGSKENGTAAEVPDLDGVRRVWALGVLPEQRSGVRMTLGVPPTVLSATADAQLRELVILLVSVALLAFIAALVVAELSIRRPAARIIRVAARLAAGDLEARIGDPRPRGELGDLMSAIDRTAGAVQAQKVEIESRSRDLGRANRTLRVLSGINTLIVRARDRDELFREACRIIVEAGGFRMAWIGTVDSSAMKVVPLAFAGGNEEIVAAIKERYASGQLPIQGNTVTALAITGKEVVVSNDTQDDPRVLLGRHHAEYGIRSMATLPLIVADEVVGVFAMYAGERDVFGEEELRLLKELAGDVAFAIDHIGTEEKIARLSRVQAVTSEINSMIVRVRNRRELFNETCRVAVDEGGFGIAWIGTFDPVTEDITPVAWAGIDSKLLVTRRSGRFDIPEGQGPAGRAVRGKEVVFENNTARLTSFGGDARLEEIRARYTSLIALPLLVEGAVSGTLSLFAKEPDFFDAEEIKLLTGLAGNISFAIENIERQDKLEKLSRIRAVSGEINAAIVRISAREPLLKEACRIAAAHGKFELVWVASLDTAKQQISPVAWSGITSEVAHAVNWTHLAAGSSSAVVEAIHTGRSAVRNDIDSSEVVGPLRAEAVRQGCHSAVCVPLLVDDKVVAVITLFTSGRNFFDSDELELLNAVASDISFALQSIARREQLDYLAYYDVLTGLANRALFHERLAQGVVNAKAQGGKVALVLLDIERFKNINDTLGRQAGDLLLKELAARMSAQSIDVSRLARLDADHFAVMATNVQSGEELARLVEQRDGEIFGPVFRIGDAELRVSARFGIAMCPDDAADADTLFRNAEAALKKAKSKGDRYLFYAQAMNERVSEKLSLEYRLRQALERDEFVLHYQPKVNLASGKLSSCEALIRWNDPQSGLVPPAQFIPILEETGLIHEVGRWALCKASADYLRWHAAGLPAVRIAVNVSPLQLRNHGFIREIERVTGADAKAAAGLDLEITESVIMEDVRHNIATLQAIRAMGVTIAIDDFGTGFSSLSYLAKLPVDALKIDRSFVADMTSGPQGMALVSTIINLAHSMKLKVVAEGVETDEQSRLLHLLRCDEMQGYLFSKPVPADVFEATFLVRPPALAA